MKISNEAPDPPGLRKTNFREQLLAAKIRRGEPVLQMDIEAPTTFYNAKCDGCGKTKKEIYQHDEQRLCQPCLKKLVNERRSS